MDLFKKIGNLFKKTPTVTMAAKELATKNGEPWVEVISVNLDPHNISNGSFEIDFNEIFVARLVKAGYKGKTDYNIVDQWFSQICRNVLAENYEQIMADPNVRTSIDLEHTKFR